MTHSDVVVIGAGVIGASIAFRLTRAGYSVTIIDRGVPGAGASGSCDQAIFLQSKRPGLHMRLALESRGMFDSLADELGANLDFRPDGGMVVIENEAQWEFMSGFVPRQREAGIDITLLPAEEARQLEPRLSPHIRGAAVSPDDAEVNPLLLNTAFLDAAQRGGARVLRNTEMLSTIENDDGVVRGVRTSSGPLQAGLVVNAAGPHAAAVGQRAGVQTPVRPRRGVILITEPVPRFINGILLCAQYVAAKHLQHTAGEIPPHGIGLSLGQTAGGSLLIGGSREFAGFSRQVDSSLITQIAKHSSRILPDLGKLRLVRVMTGFRPYTGDGLPIIEESRPGWITAAGHEGDGIALAPITGQLVLDLIRGEGPGYHYLPALSSDRPSLGSPESSHPSEAVPCGQ